MLSWFDRVKLRIAGHITRNFFFSFLNLLTFKTITVKIGHKATIIMKSSAISCSHRHF